jgi:acyl-CoA thioester hydrolase
MGATREGVPAAAVAGWKDGWFVVPHEVIWRDLDAMGHVNNAVYFEYFETARTKYWFVLNETREIQDLTFIVVRAECDFRSELNLLDPIEICVRVTELRNTSLDFLCEVRHAGTGTVAATGKVVVVLFSWSDHRKMEIGDDLRRRITDFQKGGGDDGAQNPDAPDGSA